MKRRQCYCKHAGDDDDDNEGDDDNGNDDDDNDDDGLVQACRVKWFAARPRGSALIRARLAKMARAP